MIKVYPINTTVDIGKDVVATITEILIRNKDHVSYKCVWWNGRQHKSEWIEEFEIEKVSVQEPKQIGFKSCYQQKN